MFRNPHQTEDGAAFSRIKSKKVPAGFHRQGPAAEKVTGGKEGLALGGLSRVCMP